MLRKALKISRPVPLVSGEVPRFHGRLLWHFTPGTNVEMNIGKHGKIRNAVWLWMAFGVFFQDILSNKTHLSGTLKRKIHNMAKMLPICELLV